MAEDDLPSDNFVVDVTRLEKSIEHVPKFLVLNVDGNFLESIDRILAVSKLDVYRFLDPFKDILERDLRNLQRNRFVQDFLRRVTGDGTACDNDRQGKLNQRNPH